MPAVWDRLADATQRPGAERKQPLSIVALGDVHAEDIAALTPYFERIEQLVLDVPPRDPLAKHRAEFNRAVDAATADWVLVLREREVVDDAAAREIASAVTAAARGFKMRSFPSYAGRPLRIGTPEWEMRLFHRRYYMRYAGKGEWDDVMVQGSVVRLTNALASVTFRSVEEHRQWLAGKAAPHSRIRRALLFVAYALSVRARDANTLRYLWVEAGYDVPRPVAG
jgi:hypothetical protein